MNREEAIMKILSKNRKAYHDYEIIDKYETGIVLTGTEIKSCRIGKINLKDSYAQFIDNELFLMNAHISQYDYDNLFNHEEKRNRKLLMHKKELIKLKQKIDQRGMTLVPLNAHLKDNHMKIELSLVKGKHNYDKRNTPKDKQQNREIARELKSMNY